MAEERKLVTLLFADVTGSTALGDTLDPEDVRALMARYYKHAQRVVGSYGGTLEKFIGDAVMAIFGLPQAHGDDAERALGAAIALRDAVTNDEVLGRAFLLRIGVNTGEVVATSDRSANDFLVTGDAVNVAARIQQGAQPGEILVSERSMSAAQSAFLFAEERQIEARGKRQPLSVFPLKSSRTTRQVARPPLVGRRQDLLQLTLFQVRALEERRPQMVTLIAPVGTGKTRLLQEFLQQLDPSDGFHVATVRCLPYGQTLTYWPLRGLLTELLDGDVTRNNVAGVFRQGGYSENEASELADAVLTIFVPSPHQDKRTRPGDALLSYRSSTLKRSYMDETEGMPVVSDAGSVPGDKIAQNYIFSAWRCLIEILSQQAPRIIVFEDLHWASDNLLDLVEYVTNMRIQASLLMIALSRPELLDRRPQWGGGKQNFTSLTLQPLTVAQTHELVKQILPASNTALRERIVERSGGNPFFALELVRTLKECCPEDAVDIPQALPDTVHAAVLARLDRLAPLERGFLQVVSVLPRRFRFSMVQKMLQGQPEREIEQALDALLAREMIVPAEGNTYAFQHRLFQDVAYGTLSRSERVRLHGRVAELLEVEAGAQLEQVVELIAYHYREAITLARQAAVPMDLPIEREVAIRALNKAGIRASRAGAFIEAHEYIQSALEIANDAEQADLYESLGDCTVWGTVALKAYQEALRRRRIDAVQDPLRMARLIRKLLICSTRGFSGEFLTVDEIRALSREAQGLAEEAHDEDESWRIRMVDPFCLHVASLGTISKDWFNVDEIRAVSLQAVEHFKRKEDWTAFSEALDGYAVASMEAGAFRAALEASQRRLTAPELPMIERTDAIHMIAQAYVLLGEYDRCLALVDEYTALFEPSQVLSYLHNSCAWDISFAAYLTGRWSIVDRLFANLQEVWERMKRDPDTQWFLKGCDSASLLIAMAREDVPAADLTEMILKHHYQQPHRQNRIRLIEAMREDVPNELALDGLDSGTKIYALLFCNEHAKTVSESFLTTDDCSGKWQGDAFNRCREIARALATGDNVRLESAIEDAEAHQLIVHAARMRIVLAQRTGECSHLERARPVLERLGDRQFLRRLEEVAAAIVSVA